MAMDSAMDFSAASSTAAWPSFAELVESAIEGSFGDIQRGEARVVKVSRRKV